MNKKSSLYIITILITTLVILPSWFGPDTIHLNFFSKGQIFEGFGVSGAWWAQHIGGDIETRRKSAEFLFSKSNGLGINIYRYNAGAGSGRFIKDDWRKTDTFYSSDSYINWDADKNAILMAKEAVKFGVNHVVLFSNSAPADMTISGTVSGGKKGKSNLSPDKYNEYSEYLIKTASFLNKYGIPIKEISPINEPQWHWNDEKNQEGCHFEPKETAAFLKVFIPMLNKKMPHIKAGIFESGEWDLDSNENYIKEIFSIEAIKTGVDSIHGHSYWSDADDKKEFADYFYEKYPNKKIVMSEWTEMKSGRDYSMDSGITLAETIIEDLTILNAVSWQYWIAVSKYDWRDGLIYADLGQNGKWDLSIPKRYYVMMHFSKFIEPGSTRIETTGKIPSVAFLTPNNKVIFICYNDSFFIKEFYLTNGSNMMLEKLYITDKDNNCNEIPLSKNGIISMPSDSVITAILNKW